MSKIWWAHVSPWDLKKILLEVFAKTNKKSAILDLLCNFMAISRRCILIYNWNYPCRLTFSKHFFNFINLHHTVLHLVLEPQQVSPGPHTGAQFSTSRSHKDTFFISYWSRNIFITLSGVSGQAASVERRAEGERGHVEPDRDTGMTLWHVRIPSTELCLAQQHETRKWATNVFPDPL